MHCACCDCSSEVGIIMTPGSAVPEWRDGADGGGDESPRWETDEYDFALDALELQNGMQTCEDTATVAPTVPVLRHGLEEPLKVGSHIVFSGTPADDVQRVSFNIGVGDDVAVHVDARLPQRCVVRNTRRRGAWGPQETAAFRPFPFAAGRPFVVEALVGERDTLWAVDGLHYCEYQHRNVCPLPTAPADARAPAVPRWLELIGASDASIDVNEVDEYPKLAPPWPQVPSRSDLEAAAAQDEPPWSANARALLPQGLPSGHQLVVEGRLRSLLHSFRVELTAGCQEWPRPDIALHFELRAYSEPHRPRQLVVLNSRSGGAWGEERHQRSAALVPGTTVTVRVVRGGAAWCVYASDGLLAELPFRAPADEVRALRLRGDLLPTAIYTAPVAPADH